MSSPSSGMPMHRFLPLLLACSLALPTILRAADPPWLGAWQEQTHPDDQMVFERERCILKDPGKPVVFSCAAYGPSEVWARSNSARCHLTLALTGDQLTITAGGNGTYHRLAAPPAALNLVPLDIPVARSITAARKAEITTEASKRVTEDQAVRTDPARRRDMAPVDGDNTAWIKTVIAEVGWPDAKRFGRETASRMFLFVQHSGDLPLMLGVLPCIEQDLRSKAVDPQDFALLYDRVQAMTGRRQRYGSQIVNDDLGKPVVWLLEDKAKVEQLRAAIGLFPLKVYLQIFAQQAHTRVGFMEQVRFTD